MYDIHAHQKYTSYRHFCSSSLTYPSTCNVNGELCCGSCAEWETPWLGPDCPYGDQASWCATLSDSDCPLNGETCCDRCCEINGPAAGYTCDPTTTSTTSTTTTSQTTTVPTTTTPTTTTTHTITTTSTLTTTTAPPTTTTTTAPTTQVPTIPVPITSTTTAASATTTNFTADCPLGDITGEILDGLTCDTLSPRNCYEPDVQTKCCVTCPALRNPSFSTDCLYGDKHSAW